MKHNYLNNTPLEKAKKEYIEFIRESGFGFSTETVNSSQSFDRVLSKAVYAKTGTGDYTEPVFGRTVAGIRHQFFRRAE